MTQTTHNIIDRDDLQAAYIDKIIDSMDLKDLIALVADQLDENLDKYTVNELIEEVEEYYPELLSEEIQCDSSPGGFAVLYHHELPAPSGPCILDSWKTTQPR